MVRLSGEKSGESGKDHIVYSTMVYHRLSLSLSLSIYIYIYIYIGVRIVFKIYTYCRAKPTMHSTRLATMDSTK